MTRFIIFLLLSRRRWKWGFHGAHFVYLLPLLFRLLPFLGELAFMVFPLISLNFSLYYLAFIFFFSNSLFIGINFLHLLSNSVCFVFSHLFYLFDLSSTYRCCFSLYMIFSSNLLCAISRLLSESEKIILSLITHKIDIFAWYKSQIWIPALSGSLTK